MPEKAKTKAEEQETAFIRKRIEDVAKYLRSNVPRKKAIIKGENAEYFVGSKAVDCLLSSKWSQGPPPPSDDPFCPYFPDRDSAVRFCDRLRKGGYFARGQKVEVKPRMKEEKEGEGDDKEGGKKPSASPKAKKKYRILFHDIPAFVDSPEEVFIWQYNPPSSQTYLFGTLVVVAAIAATLYPLWPENVRVLIYYLSSAGLILVGALCVLYILRLMLFAIVWMFTTGKVHFWLFPNLNDDSYGFFESFRPLYSVKGLKRKKKGKKKDGESKKKDGDDRDGQQQGEAKDEEEEEEEVHEGSTEMG